MTHVAPCDGRCFGLMCRCGYSACLSANFDHSCPFGQANAAWALFMGIAAFAIVFGLLAR